MNILIASGAFKDVFSPTQACKMIANVIKSLNLSNSSIAELPVADGGEYSNATLQAALGLRKRIVKNVINPYGEEVVSHYLEIDSNSAFLGASVILGLDETEEIYKNPLHLTSYGYGQLISDALKRGYENIYLGLGGTSTVDAGIGAAQALGVKFFGKGEPLVPNNGRFFSGLDLTKIENIERPRIGSKDVQIHALCDGNALLNQMDRMNRQKIGLMYSDQSDEINKTLKGGIDNYISIVEGELNSKTGDKIPLRTQEYYGVAGGINLSISYMFNSIMSHGVEFFIHTLGVREKIKDADLVVTGEGKFDNSLDGKTPVGICRMSKSFDKQTLILTGTVSGGLKNYFNNGISFNLPPEFQDAGIDYILSCHDYFDKVELPNDPTLRNKLYRETTPKILSDLLDKYFSWKEEP